MTGTSSILNYDHVYIIIIRVTSTPSGYHVLGRLSWRVQSVTAPSMAPQNTSLLIAILVLQLLGPAPVVAEATSSPSEGNWIAVSPEQRIAATIKTTLAALTEEDIASQMEHHL